MKSLFFASTVLVVLVIIMQVISGLAQKTESEPNKALTRDYNAIEQQLTGN